MLLISLKHWLLSSLFLFSSAEKPMGTVEVTTDLTPGKGHFVFNEYKPLSDKPLKTWYYLPEELPQDAPIMILMHGNSRAAESYLDAMTAQAERYGFLLIVPEFSKKLFPRVADYHHGGVFDRQGRKKAPEEWTFSLIEPLFDHVKQRTGNTSSGYVLYGFSAGSQFVHRFMTFKPENRALRIVSASAGTYTMLDPDIKYSYGLGNTDIPKENLETFFGKDFTVAVGEADTVLSRNDLVKSSRANRQGRDRVERARTYFEQGKAIAEQAGVPFNWKLRTVPGVGHKQPQMAEPVADMLFGNQTN